MMNLQVVGEDVNNFNFIRFLDSYEEKRGRHQKDCHPSSKLYAPILSDISSIQYYSPNMTIKPHVSGGKSLGRERGYSVIG